MKRVSKTDIRLFRTAYGSGGLLLGLLLTLGGAWLAGAGLGLLPIGSGVHAPLGMIVAIGLAFLLAGLTLAARALQGIRNRSRARVIRNEQPEAPWMADYPWNPNGIQDEAASRAFSGFFSTLLFGVFLIPFNWLAFFSGPGPLFVQGLVGLFDVVWVISAGTACFYLLQFARYGHSRLIFSSFPLAPGDLLRVVFTPNRFRHLRVTLRYVEEFFQQEGHGEDRSVHHETTEYFSESRDLDLPARPRFLELSFHLPANPEWTTRMTAAPTVRYWELVVESRLEPGGFRTTFPLPVYPEPIARRLNPDFERFTRT